MFVNRNVYSLTLTNKEDGNEIWKGRRKEEMKEEKIRIENKERRITGEIKGLRIIGHGRVQYTQLTDNGTLFSTVLRHRIRYQ